MKKRIIISLGLPGSFRWALRKMKKGQVVTRKSITGTLRFKTNKQSGTVLWCFDSTANYHEHKGTHRWGTADLSIEYIEALDWCLLIDHPKLFHKLRYTPKK